MFHNILTGDRIFLLIIASIMLMCYQTDNIVTYCYINYVDFLWNCEFCYVLLHPLYWFLMKLWILFHIVTFIMLITCETYCYVLVIHFTAYRGQFTFFEKYDEIVYKHMFCECFVWLVNIILWNSLTYFLLLFIKQAC